MHTFLIILLILVLFFPAVMLAGFICALFGRYRLAYLNQIFYQFSCLLNTVCGRLFNKTLAKKDGYSFGKKDEMTSSAIGKNIQLNKLTIVAKVVNFILNLFQKDHAIKNIQA